MACSDVYLVELICTQMIHSKHKLLCLDVETDNGIIRQSRLEQFLTTQ